jgi:hypothetical protein
MSDKIMGQNRGALLRFIHLTFGSAPVLGNRGFVCLFDIAASMYRL